MSSLPVLRRRIKSVTSTRQITKAMQMVAASKLHQAQAALPGPLPYAKATAALASELAGWPQAARHIYFADRSVRKVLLLLITSDQGLAGAYNNSLLQTLARETADDELSYTAICVGRKGAAAVARLSGTDELAVYDIEGGEIDVRLAKPIAREIAEGFLSGQFEQVRLISTRFVTTIQNKPAVITLLPIAPPAQPTAESRMEPGLERLIEETVSRYLEAAVLQALTEARASEQAARMLSMMNATDNAGHLIEDLTLSYHQERQEAITEELAEISAGVEALGDQT